MSQSLLWEINPSVSNHSKTDMDRQHCVVRQPVMRIAGCQWALKQLRGGSAVQRPRLFTVEKPDSAESSVAKQWNDCACLRELGIFWALCQVHGCRVKGLDTGISDWNWQLKRIKHSAEIIPFWFKNQNVGSIRSDWLVFFCELDILGGGGVFFDFSGTFAMLLLLAKQRKIKYIIPNGGKVKSHALLDDPS